MRETQEGLAPHGMRHSGEGVKGSGYFGYLPASDGYATEMSAENEGGEFPLLVPTLSKEEIEHLLAGNSPTDEIFRKAVEHAERRKKEGKSPYADPTGLKHPVPKADGGSVYSPRPGLVFVGQEHGQIPELPPDVKEMANKVGAFYEGSGGDRLPDIRYRGSWDDAASKSVKGYPPEYLYTIFTNTDVNKQKDALVGDDTIFNSLLKNQRQVGYFKDRRFSRKELENFLGSMGSEFLSGSKNIATESNVEDFLKRGEKLMWESGKTSARDMADKANESRQRWLLSQPKGVFFVGSDHLEKLKELHGAGKGASVQKKAEGGTVNYELPDDVTPQNWRDQLETNVLNDARALIGVKEGGPINLDRLLEKAVRKANGGPANLDEMLSWAVAKHNHKMKKGGEVSQTFPLKKDEEEERMFSPAPLKIPEPITDALEALKRQFEKEKRSMSKPGAVQDVLMRGPVAMYAGAPADIVGMGGELLDYVQTKIPGMRKPASVMDTGPEKVPPMGYAPAFPLTPNEPYGTEAAQELMKQSGLTTGTERPLFEITSGVAAPFAGMAAMKTGKALAPTAKEMTQFALEKSMEPYQMNIIKPEGGNWVRGAAEKYLKDLRYDESLIDPVGVMNPTAKAEETARVASMNNFVDKKLSRYLVNQMGTPSDPLRLQADTWAETQKKLLADKDKQIDKVRSDIRKAQQARGVDPEVLTRSQARLRELQKERELINNRKGLHFDPGHDDFRQRIGRDARSRAEMPQENLGVTEVAKNWEDLSDSAIRQGAYKDMIPIVENSVSAQLAAKTPEEYNTIFQQLQRESLEKAGGQFAVDNPEALAYGMNSGRPARDLRFDHMMDEIDNALRPSQGLPDYLQLKSKDLDKMSVAQVSEHVDKINAWRASQKAEVDAARAANAATVEHKAYDVVPGTDIPNDQGLRWVEIKAPENMDLPEGYSIKHDPSRDRNGNIVREGYRLVSPEGKMIDYGSTPEEAIKNYFGKQVVEDALKYEGEILQHCVGGYCPDVIEGRSRIFSLRDADGRPHATIETKPIKETGRRSDIPDDIKEELRARGEAIGRQKADELGFGPYSEEAALEEKIAIAQLMDDWLYENPLVSEKIAQIKGLQNKKPNDEYMPFIQDFVKSGQWSDVGDLHNTGLFKVTEGQKLPGFAQEIPPGFYTLDDLKKMAVENEMPQEILDNWMSKLDEQRFRFLGMKRGGRVTKADLEQQYRMAFGGGVFNTDPDITDSGRIIPEHTI